MVLDGCYLFVICQKDFFPRAIYLGIHVSIHRLLVSLKVIQGELSLFELLLEHKLQLVFEYSVWIGIHLGIERVKQSALNRVL